MKELAMGQCLPVMKLIRMPDKSSIQGVAKVTRRERTFKLSLPTLVSGIDAYGNSFQERTDLCSISSQQATFWLNSGVTIGSKLNLSLEIPKTLILENKLRLLLSGTVVHVKAESNSKKKQLISIQLDRTYKIQSNSPKI